jgi:TolB protein
MLKGITFLKPTPKRAGLLALAFAAAALFFKLGTGPTVALVAPRPPGENSAGMDGKGSIQKLVFSRGRHIYLYEAGDGAVRRLAEGRTPSISPSGKVVAFLQDDDPAGDSSSIRILDLATGRVSTPGPLAAVNASKPAWSPGSDRLAFEALVNNRFQVGVYDPAGGSLKVLSEAVSSEDAFGVFLDSWAPDGKSILAHSLQNVYELSLDGKVLRKLPVDKLKAGGLLSGISSANRFSFSGDKQSLLFDAINRGPEDWGLFIYELESGRLSRLTPGEVVATEPLWLPSGRGVLFTRIRGGGKRLARDVEIIPLGGAKTETVVRDAFNASFF